MSSDLDTKFPEIFYDKEKHNMYEYLKGDPESPFKGQTYASIFIFAMALAKRNGLLPESLKKPSKMQSNAFDTVTRTLMRSIMISEKHDVYSIKNNIELRKMCEEYANVGIDKLYFNVKNKSTWKAKEDVLMDLITS